MSYHDPDPDFRPPRLVDTFIAGVVIIVVVYLLSFFASCARVPLAATSPDGGGRVAKVTTLGGIVSVETPEGYKVITDHRLSFSDAMNTIDKTGNKVLGWKLGDRLFDRADTADTIEAAAARDADAADLARLNAGNQHTLDVLRAEQAHELATQSLP